ncbi:nitrogen regulation protein NR(II) [Thermodesulfobacteriota bacterium]
MKHEHKMTWERTFDAIKDVVTIQDCQMRIICMNRAAARLFNGSAQEFIGKHCYEVFQGKAEPCADCPQWESFDRSRSHTMEIEHARLKKTFRVTALPIFNDVDEFTGVVHLGRDITMKKWSDRQLRQSQKMESIGLLAGGIVHDLNNLLFPIIGYTEMALASLSEDSRIRNNLEKIMESADRTIQLIRQIRTFSHQNEQTPVTVKMQPLIKKALTQFQESLPSTIQINMHLDDSSDAVRVDPLQLRQALMHLFSNAKHAMRDQGGKLKIVLKNVRVDAGAEVFAKLKIAPGKYVRLSISDTGEGMDQEVIERIFDPYFTTKGKGKGVGLGLTMVHGSLRKNGGHITVHSIKGEGTTFHIYLPAVEHPPESASIH